MSRDNPVPIDPRLLNSNPQLPTPPSSQIGQNGANQPLPSPHRPVQRPQQPLSPPSDSRSSSYLGTPQSQRTQGQGYSTPQHQLIQMNTLGTNPQQSQPDQQSQSQSSIPVRSLWTPRQPQTPQPPNVQFMRPLTTITNCPFFLPIPLNQTLPWLERLSQERKTLLERSCSRIPPIMRQISTIQNLTEAQHNFREQDYLIDIVNAIVLHVESIIGYFDIETNGINYMQPASLPATLFKIFEKAIKFCFFPADIDARTEERGDPRYSTHMACLKKCAELMAANEAGIVLQKLVNLLLWDLAQEQREAGIMQLLRTVQHPGTTAVNNPQTRSAVTQTIETAVAQLNGDLMSSQHTVNSTSAPGRGTSRGSRAASSTARSASGNQAVDVDSGVASSTSGQRGTTSGRARGRGGRGRGRAGRQPVQRQN